MNNEIEIIPELEKMSKIWYNTPAIAFELIASMKHRESVFIAKNRPTVQRMLKINAVRYMYMNFDRYKFYDEEFLYNVYSSVAHFPSLPMSSFKWEEKKEQVALFNANFIDYVKGYDLFIDLDNENPKLVYASTKRLKQIFDKYQLPYSLIFSGAKGFHINIEYKDLPEKLQQMKYKDLSILFKLFAYELKISEKIKDIDTSIYDLRRIRKTPYSIVYPFYYIALPLSNEQFDNFSFDMVFLPNLIDEATKFTHRGLLTRDGNNENLLKLMSDIAIKRKKVGNLYKLFKINKQTLFSFMKNNDLMIGDDNNVKN